MARRFLTLLLLSLVSAGDFVLQDLYNEPKYEIVLNSEPKGLDISPDYGPFKMNGTDYFCYMSETSQDAEVGVFDRENKNDSILRQAVEALLPLQTYCLFYQGGPYWIYEVCFGRYIMQLPISQLRQKLKKQALQEGSYFYLAIWPSQLENALYMTEKILEDPNTWTLDLQQSFPLSSRGPEPKLESSEIPTATLEMSPDGVNYVTQVVGTGSSCNLTGQNRTVEIQYKCAEGEQEVVVSLKEIRTCHYQLIIHTNRLCKIPSFSKSISSNTINCFPRV